MKHKLDPVGLKPDDDLFAWWDKKEREWKEIVRAKAAAQNKPDDVMTLDLINEAVKKAKLVGINGPLSMYVWPDTPWTCTLCGHIQPISKTTCQGCGKEARAKLR